MVLYIDGIVMAKQRLCDLNSCTITQKGSQEQTLRVSYDCHKILKSTSLSCSKIHSDR